MSSEADTTCRPPSASHAPPKNVPWTFDENDILLLRVKDNVDSRGRPKWAAVAKGLPGRTAQEARCRYRRISDAETRRKRGESFRNKCHTCGQLRRGHVCPGVTVASRDAKLAAARAGCPPVRGHETQGPALPAPATEALAPLALAEIKVADEAPEVVEEAISAPCEEPGAPKLEVEVSFEKLEVSAEDTIEDSKTVDEREAFPLLPNSMQSPTVMPESPAPVSLQEFLAKFEAPPASLDRQPSLDVMSFFHGGRGRGASAPKDPSALGLGASLIEVM